MKQKKLIFLIIILVLALAALAYFLIPKNNEKKEPIKNMEVKIQPSFSYASSSRPEYSKDGDTEGYALPGTYKIKSQNWEGDKLKIVVTAQANLCAKKEGYYTVWLDGSIILFWDEDLETACNGNGFFDFTFIVGPIPRKNYEVTFTNYNGWSFRADAPPVIKLK